MIIDDREPKPQREVILNLAKSSKVEAIVRRLKFGDFLLSPESGKNIVAIERKEVNDLLNSLSSGRLRRQLSGLKSDVNLDTIFLLVEGTLSHKIVDGTVWAATKNREQTGWRWLAVADFLASIQLPNNNGPEGDSDRTISLMWTLNFEQTAMWVIGFYKYLSNRS